MPAQAEQHRAIEESPFPPVFREEVDRLEALLARAGKHGPEDRLPRYLVERLLLDVGGYVEERIPLKRRSGRDPRGAGGRRGSGWPRPAVRSLPSRRGCVTAGSPAWSTGWWSSPAEPVSTLSDRLDAVLTHRVWGILVLAAVLVLMFSAVFSWAKLPMEGIEAAIAWLSGRIEELLPDGPLRSLLVDGILGGIGAVVIFLPQIFILFLILTSLEECGYLARAAYLMDRMMVRVGLSGKSFIPLLSSFACAIPAVMATRVIENRRDRLTTILIAPLMSCSARLPVYTLMIAAFIPEQEACSEA